MLRKKQEYKYLKRRWFAMLSHVIGFAESHDPEELHKMRVEIKKINAALKVSSESLRKRDLNPLKKIFRDAGAVRDIDVGLGLMEQWCPENQVLKNEQNELLTAGSQKFYLKTPEYIRNNIRLFKVVGRKLHAVKDQRLLRWYNRQLNEVNRLFAAQYIGENLHLCRKKIKNILYGYGLAKNILQGKLPINTLYLDRLQEKIGQWHDTVSALEFLSEQQSLNKEVITRLNGARKRQVRSLVSLSAGFKNKALTLPKGTKTPGKTNFNAPAGQFLKP